MKIEVGKNYINANGEIVHIVKHLPNTMNSMTDTSGRTYTEEGYWQWELKPNPHKYDLICEVVSHIALENYALNIDYEEFILRHIEYWTGKPLSNQGGVWYLGETPL